MKITREERRERREIRKGRWEQFNESFENAWNCVIFAVLPCAIIPLGVLVWLGCL